MTEYYHTLLEKGGRTAEEKAAALEFFRDTAICEADTAVCA